MALRPESLVAQVSEVAATYRRINDDGRERMRELWMRLCAEPETIFGVGDRPSSFMVPRPASSDRQGIELQCVVRAAEHPYGVGAIDGSQVYPDHHEGVPFFLLHTAALLFKYGAEPSTSAFSCTTKAAVLSNHDCASVGGYFSSPTALVDSMRTEYELRAGLALAGGQDPLFPLLFDGSLIFWHVRDYGAMRDPFFKAYGQLLEAFAANQIATAWYTSLPQGTDLVNLVRAIFPIEADIAYKTVVDSDLLTGWLPACHRTAVFFSGTDIAARYPVIVRPAFFYVNVGDEIARVEVPAWIAACPSLCDQLAGIIIDQCGKGQGYPLCLAEAHEHAVVRGADRRLFFDCARQALAMDGDPVVVSRKTLHKRRAGF